MTTAQLAPTGTDRRRASASAALLAAPLLMLCFVATYDGVLWATMHRRLAGAASTVARTVAASARPAEVDLPALLAEVARLAAPSDVAGLGGVVVGEWRDGGLLWQARIGPAGPPNLAAATPGPTPRQAVIVASVTSPPDPWIVGLPLLRAWFGDIAQATATAPLAAPAP